MSLLNEYVMGEQQAHGLIMSIQEAEQPAASGRGGDVTSVW